MATSSSRLSKLSKVFAHNKLNQAWKTVRSGLRDQELKDLHDYLDIHRNLDLTCRNLRDDILSDNYTVRKPQVVLKEKNDGICRRIVIPAGRDALVLQTVVEHLEGPILESEPSDSAYYSRSHTPPRSFDNVDSSFTYAWWKLWPEFQNQVFQFSRNYQCLVVTDVSKYFDTVNLDNLRNAVTSIDKFSEEVVDFLFFVLRQFVWSPEYAPHSRVGLPQINFDAPRLLAHCFMYDIDAHLEDRDGIEFRRWMDDISMGVDSPGEGKRLLKEIDLRLGRKGLRLNSGKSGILDSKEAERKLRIKENIYIDAIEKRRDMHLPTDVGNWCKYAKGLYDRIKDDDRWGRWTKVIKRFFTLFSKFDDSYLQSDVANYLRDYPSLRKSIYRYYRSVGYTRSRFNHILSFLKSPHCIDDVSLFGGLFLISEWNIPYNSPSRSEARDLVTYLHDKNQVRSVALIAGGVRVKAKYGASQPLWDFIDKVNPSWRSSDWASRQVAAVMPLLPEERRTTLRRKLESQGLTQGLQVYSHLLKLRKRRELDQQLRSYLTADTGYYDFAKVLIAINQLQGNLKSEPREDLRADIRNLIDDEVNDILIRNA